ncbi:MAG: FtsX-like permease family protein [Clostridiales bacterium]|jgi:ABC-type antimicrobial peptide transport system permease subunit|nr:FtsX-like permease family protein [Clostridiales bacterium]
MGITLQEGQFLQSKDEWGMMFGSAVAQNFMTARERNNWYMQMNRDPNAKPKVDLMNDRLQASADYSFGMETNTPVEEGYEGYEGESQNAQPPVKPHNVNAVAIMAPGDDYETTSAAFMNIKTVQLLMKEREEMWGRQAREYNGYEVTRIKATTVAAVENITAALQDMGFSENIIQTPTSYISELKGTMASLQTLLGAMGIISLFIATIGISNTMVMSTVERTREIGVMKVIGASLRDIRKLFLLEAAIIGFLGGLLGVGVSYIASFILNNNGQSLFAFMDAYSYYGEMMSSDVSIIPIWLSAASLGFAAIIGLIAGFFPAQRATTISALSAIRAE